MLFLISIYLVIFKLAGVSVSTNLILGYLVFSVGIALIFKIIATVSGEQPESSEPFRIFASYFLPSFSLIWTLALLDIAAISWGILIAVFVIYIIWAVLDQILN